MKIAIVHTTRRRIRRIVDVVPAELPSGVEAVEITDEQAAEVAEARSEREGIFLVDGNLLGVSEARELLQPSPEERVQETLEAGAKRPPLPRLVKLLLSDAPVAVRAEFLGALAPGLLVGDREVCVVRVKELDGSGKPKSWVQARARLLEALQA